jgi:hypothetical protein
VASRARSASPCSARIDQTVYLDAELWQYWAIRTIVVDRTVTIPIKTNRVKSIAADSIDNFSARKQRSSLTIIMGTGHAILTKWRTKSSDHRSIYLLWRTRTAHSHCGYDTDCSTVERCCDRYVLCLHLNPPRCTVCDCRHTYARVPFIYSY